MSSRLPALCRRRRSLLGLLFLMPLLAAALPQQAARSAGESATPVQTSDPNALVGKQIMCSGRQLQGGKFGGQYTVDISAPPQQNGGDPFAEDPF